MSVSDKVVAIDFGRKIAEGTPAEVQRNPDVIRPISERGPRYEQHARSRRPQGLLRPVAGAARHRLLAGQGRHHHAARRQRRRQDDDAARDLQHGAHRGRRFRSTGNPWPARRRRRSFGSASGTCRRAAARSRRSASTRTCASPPTRVATRRRPRATSRWSSRISRASRSAWRSRPGTLSGGEQQMLAISRALMLRPAPDAARRAVVRSGAADRAGDLPHHAAHQPGSRRCRCCSSSRTRRWRWSSPTTPTCSRPAASSCRAPRPRSAERADPQILSWLLRQRARMEQFFQQVASGLANGAIYALPGAGAGDDLRLDRSHQFRPGRDGDVQRLSCAGSSSHGATRSGSRCRSTMLFSFAVGVTIERVILRPLHNAPVLSIVVVFIGLLAIFHSLAGAIWSHTIKPFPSPFPNVTFAGSGFIGAASDRHDRGRRWSCCCALFAFFRFTPLGLAMRAAAQNPDLGAPRRRPRRLDAGARLGAGGGRRRGGWRPGGAGRLSSSPT